MASITVSDPLQRVAKGRCLTPFCMKQLRKVPTCSAGMTWKTFWQNALMETKSNLGLASKIASGSVGVRSSNGIPPSSKSKALNQICPEKG